MNFRTNVVNFLGGRLLERDGYWRGALIREGRLFRNSYFLEGCLLERGTY